VVISQNGADNGVHETYARPLDLAGSFLDSKPVEVTISDSNLVNN